MFFYDSCDGEMSDEQHQRLAGIHQPLARHGQGYDGAEGQVGDGGRGDRALLVASWHQAVEEVQHDQNPQL